MEPQGIFAAAEAQAQDKLQPHEQMQAEAATKMATTFQQTMNAGIREYMAAMLQKIHVANHNAANLAYVDKAAVGNARGLSQDQLSQVTPFPSPPTINYYQGGTDAGISDREKELERRVAQLQQAAEEERKDKPIASSGDSAQSEATRPAEDRGFWSKLWPLLLMASVGALGGGAMYRAVNPPPDVTSGAVDLEIEGWQQTPVVPQTSPKS